MLEALKIKLKAPVRYFCQVTHLNLQDNEAFQTPIILCLGEHSMFLLDEKMQELLGEVFYAHTIRVVEQNAPKGPEDVMRIEINDDRPKGIPAKITLISSEKTILLKHLRCYWETDYIWRMAKIGVLRVDREEINLKKFNAKAADTTSREQYGYCSNSSQKDSQKGYCYFYPNFLRKTRLIGEYVHIDNAECFLKVEIEDAQQLENLKDDLRTKAEFLAEDELKPGENYCFVKNSPYMKKMDLVVDLASWSGWEVVLKTTTRYIALIVLRRKFIPPLMDSGQDFVFLTVGDNLARKISMEPADSMHTKGISNIFYKIILDQRCEALIMDEGSANFYQTVLGTTPKSIQYAYMFIYSVKELIFHDQRSPDIDVLDKELGKYPNVKKFGKHPEQAIEAFFNLSQATGPGYRKWRQKVCRYLAYAIDGGLFQSKFTLEEVLKAIMGGAVKEITDLTILKRCIKLLLHVKRTTDECDAQSEELYVPINTLLTECSHKRIEGITWVFNEKVMISLIEVGYLQRELDISGNTSVYPQLLIFLLQSPMSSLELKSVVCRVTVGIEEAELSALKPLIPSLIDIFIGKNYTLATQAAVSLINLIYQNRENKQTLFKNLGLLVKRLASKDQKLLSYSILLLTNLASETSRRKAIANQIRDYLINILTGKVVEKEFITQEVLSRTVQAIITIMKDHSTVDYIVNSNEIIENCVEYVAKFDDLLPRLAWLLELMAEKSKVSLLKIAKFYMAALVKRLNDNLSTDVLKNLLSLIKVLIAYEEPLQLALENNIKSVLRQLYTLDTVSNDFPTRKIIASIIQILPK